MLRSDLPAAIRAVKQRVYERAREERLTPEELDAAKEQALRDFARQLEIEGDVVLAGVVRQHFCGVVE